MKGRTVKLREAHKAGDNASTSFCSVIWNSDATHLVTASSSDPSVLIHDYASLPSQQKQQSSSRNQNPKVLQVHKDGVTSLAISPDSLCLASGSVDHSVKIHEFPGGVFQSNITRFTLPIRSLAYNKSGSLLAAAGDDDGIKLIATIDSSIYKLLKGHKGSVTGLAFDPNNEYLASVDGSGTVIFWELSSGKIIHTLDCVAPDCGSDTSVCNVLNWSPDGETLAVPGLRNDVVMYDRDTAEKMFSLKGEHERRVCFMAWSPNGKYMATSSLDRQILIWDVDLRQDIERQKFDDSVSYLAWKPNGNALAVIDVTGRFGVWDNPIPTCMKSPIDGAPDKQSRKTNGLLLFDDDDNEEDEGEEQHHHSNLDGFDNSEDEDSFGELAPVSRKRLRKRAFRDENLDDDSDGGQEGLLRQIESRKKSAKRDIGHSGRKVKERVIESMKVEKKKMQEAFQPCSVPAQSGKRHFLCYNMLGSITTMENDGYSHIEVDFHDTGRGSRVPSMTDYFGFTMASLSETGSVFANPGNKGEKKTSTLMYRPFSSWANNTEWSMRFEAEEVKVVALGQGWIAAITNLNILRIFTEGGLQKYIISLGGPVITAAGFKDELAVVTHASDCLSSGDQMLDVKVYNISSATSHISCRLPLTPRSCLSWFGFSEEGHLSSYDSKGVLRVFMDHFGGSWLPLFSSDKVKQSEDENHWVVGLNATKLFCIVCKPPDLYPTVMPKPILTLFNLSFPLASSDLGASEHENELIFCNMRVSQIQKKIEQLAASGLDTATLDDEAFDMEASRDRCILRLIANCCNGDKLVRATELAKLLSLEKSFKGAIKLVTALKLPVLAEKFNCILEERLLKETTILSIANAAGSQVTPKTTTAMTINSTVATNDGLQVTPKTTTVISTARRNITPVSTMSPLSMKSSSSPIQVSTLRSNSLKPDIEEQKKIPSKISAKVLEKEEEEEESDGKPAQPSKSFKKLEDNLINKTHSRPPNPFAKAATSNEDKPSIFDSLKKMKKDEDEKKVVSNKKLKV